MVLSLRGDFVFLSTLSLRRATPTASRRKTTDMNFYPRSPCGERPRKGQRSRAGIGISIHALLAESDTLICEVIAEMTISIHALLAESDARRASRQQPAGISIHALLAESDRESEPALSQSSISIHALLAESDSGKQPSSGLNIHFYPRSPCGERLFNAYRS